MFTVLIRHGDKFSHDYYKAWKTMIPDCIIVGDDVPFRYHWEGWFALYEMFSPEFEYRPCLYFDLDTYILRNIQEFYEPPDRLMMISDFYHPTRENAGVMQIPKNVDDIWNAIKHLQSKGNAPGNVFNSLPHGVLNKKYPNKIVSYKAHNLQRQKPSAPIMCFHGKPKPHEVTGWAGDLWRELVTSYSIS
jgi:hypothetical protein